MRIKSVRADQETRRHMWRKHRVELYEVEQVLLGDRDARRSGRNRYFYDGRTAGGRLLRVVFEVRRHTREVTADVVTAFLL